MSDAVYARIRDEFIKSLERGVAPWKKPWTPAVPMSYFSHKPYQGVNFMMLAMMGYRSVWWVTMTEVKKNGRVKEGCENNYFPVLAPIMRPVELDSGEKIMIIRGVRYINVYNRDDVEGIEFPEENFLDFKPITVLDDIFKSMPNRPVFSERMEGQCYYTPFHDRVNVQKRERFDSELAYYRIKAHEVVHSTGHPKRLNRPEIAKHVEDPLFSTFHLEAYAFEELIAEIGANMLLARAGVQMEVEQNSVAYVQHWLQHIKASPPKLIVEAAKRAQEAVNYIFGDSQKEEMDETAREAVG